MNKDTITALIARKFGGSITPSPGIASMRNKLSFPNTSPPKSKRKQSSQDSLIEWLHTPSEDGQSVKSYNSVKQGTTNTNKLLIKMYERQIANSSENLKMAHKTNLVLKQQAHRKYKQLETRFKAEKALWKDRELQYKHKLEDIQKQTKENERVIKEKWIQLKEYEKKVLVSKDSNNKTVTINTQAQQQILLLKQQITQLQSTNHEIVKQSNAYRMENNQYKRTIMNANTIMKQLQDEIKKLKKRMQTLEYENNKYRMFQQALKKSSNEQLLEQKIKLLKNQRKTLVSEVKKLRDKNDQLKHLIAGGGMSSVNMYKNGF